MKDNHTITNPGFFQLFSPVRCDSCGGYFILKEGRYGVFGGCTRYPSCRSTINKKDFLKSFFETNGIKVYHFTRTCYKCHNKTDLYSYYLQLDLMEFVDELTSGEPLILGTVPYLDRALMSYFPSIKTQYSRTLGKKYVTNTCTVCGALQGQNYLLDDYLDPLMERISDGYSAEKNIAGKILLRNYSLIQNDVDDIV